MRCSRFAPMARLADRLVYFPSRVLDGGTPAALGLTYEDVELAASDGVRLHAWFVPAPRTPPVVLFLHEIGAAVMLLDYRGYGRSDGTPGEEGTYHDAAAAYDWLRRRHVAAQRIVVYGESLGGPIATDLASHRPVGGLILESAPSSIIGVARHHYPFLPVTLFLSIRYDAAAKIGGVRSPLLILHSPTDEIVPFSMAEELYAAANQPKRLVRLGGAHNDNFIVAAEAYRTALSDFLQRRKFKP